jgi:hypothetical protein
MRNLFLIVVLGMARAEECFVSKNCNTNSSTTIDVTRPNDAFECLEDCKKQIGCKWWTWNDWADWCVLLEDCIQPFQCGASCTSGQVTCEEYFCGITGLCLVFKTFELLLFLTSNVILFECQLSLSGDPV